MQAYQPLNRYEFCQTKKTIRQSSSPVKKSTNAKSSFKSMSIKITLSMLLIVLVLVTTVFVKIEAREPISKIPAEHELSVVVGTGDSLWRLATTYYKDVEDTGYAVYLIKERNGINESVIYPGQTIILPEIKP